MLFVKAMLYTLPFRFSINMNLGLNLHRLQNLSSKITKPQVDLTRGSDRGTPEARLWRAHAPTYRSRGKALARGSNHYWGGRRN